MKAKIGAPALPSSILHREALIAQLREIVVPSSTQENAPHSKLVLLCAPAGYGKTTLLADFARQSGIACCWYFLDQYDADPFIFLSNLLASIRYRFPQSGIGLDALLAEDHSAISSTNDSQHYQKFVDALLAALETEITERFVLLLCNFHEVDESPAISGLMNLLVQKMPSQGVLIIESRATPSIDFAPLLARGEAIGWNSNSLRLNAQEVQELAHAQGVAPLSSTEAEQLATAFDGWIAGILLGTRLGDARQFRASSRTSFLQGLPSLRVEGEKLLAYFVNEVFRDQPALYAFLKEAVILQQMMPAFCDALLRTGNAGQYLEQLARRGMFVSCRDDGSQLIYTCHPVLRELLCEELHRTAPEQFVELHSRAARLFEASHDYENAISHALAASDSQHAAQLIIRAHQEMISRTEGEKLLRWLDALPAEMVEQSPRLLLVRAGIHLIRTEYRQALPLLDAAEALSAANSLAAPDATDLSHLQIELMVLRGKAFFQAGRYEEGLHVCQQVLETTPVDEVILRADAHTYAGICITLMGDIAAGIEHLQKALQLWGRNTVRFQTAEVYSALANNYHMIGNFALAEHHLSRSIGYWEQLHDEKGKASNLLRLGIYKCEQGAFTEAESMLAQALAMTEGIAGFEREKGYILENLGLVYQEQERYVLSLQTLEQSVDLGRQLKDNFLINGSLCRLAMTYLLMGDANTAFLLLSETNLPAMHNDLISYERAVHDLTYGFIFLHQHSYEQAYTLLSPLEASLERSGIKFELLQARLFLAACQLARGKEAEAIHYLDRITAILEIHDYGQFFLARVKQFPAVYQLVRTQPALARLRTLLTIETPLQKSGQVATRISSSPPVVVSSKPRIKIQAFGEPAVFLNEQPITRWRMARSMELFFYLLDCGRPMRKEQIITALWSEADEQINQTFHSTVHYLRKALADAAIISHGGSYSLDLSVLSDKQVQYDVAMFREQYTQAKRFLAGEDDTDAREALLAMVQLYQGDYVQPFYSDWCMFRRDELRRSYLEARNYLAQLAWRREEFDESAIHWQHMLVIDNCLEEAHYGLMRYYARTGKRGLALRQYQRCAEALRQELAARPGPAIQSLYQRLKGSSEQIKKQERSSSRQ